MGIQISTTESNTLCVFKRTAKPTRVAIEELQLQDLQNMEAEGLQCQLSTDHN